MILWAKYKGLAMLVLLLVLAPTLVWQYAVSGTVGQWHATKNYRRQIEQLRRADNSIVSQPSAILNDEMILSGEFVATLLPTIEREKLHIEHFSPYVISDADGVRLTTGMLTVRGGFAGMVRLLDFVEREVPHCKIISTTFKTSRPRNRDTAKTLNCTIYVQQITDL